MRMQFASLLSIVVGILSFASGMSVLAGIREVEYSTVLSLIIYNAVAGALAFAAGLGLWKGKAWAVRLTAIIAGTHLVVLTLVSFGYLKGGPVAVESLYAMAFRVIVWIGIIVLIPIRNQR
jgi:hypothetical protein